MALLERGLIASDLAVGASISLSMALKLMSDFARPSLATAERIETFLNCRIYSSPTAYKARLAAKKLDAHAQELSVSRDVSLGLARRLALQDFPEKLTTSTPT